MSLTKVRVDLWSEMCRIRNLYNLVYSDDFNQAFNEANLAQQELAEKLILAKDLAGLKTWMSKNGGKETLYSLQNQARNLGIPYWSRLNKDDLKGKIDERVNQPLRNNQATSFKLGPDTSDSSLQSKAN